MLEGNLGEVTRKFQPPEKEVGSARKGGLHSGHRSLVCVVPLLPSETHILFLLPILGCRIVEEEK